MMLKSGSKDGEMVKGGTVSKIPPAVWPTLGLIIIGVLPPYLSSLYGAYTQILMEAYVAFGFLFIGLVLAGLSFMVFRDRSALTHSMKVFRFRPDAPAYNGEELAPIKVQSDRIVKE